MNECIINDNRDQSFFKCKTFSKHNKGEVKTILLASISDGKIESACHWTAELICAGHYSDLWELIFLYMSRYIHLGNPKIVFYLENRYKIFKQIVENANFIHLIELRNNVNIRRLFSEIICVLCQSKKRHSIELIKIDASEAFVSNEINGRLRASSTHYIDNIFRKNDPNCLFIALNEFSYNISKDSLDMKTACYWVEWILEYETVKKKMKVHIICELRENKNIDEQFQSEPVWIIWEAILHSGKDKSTFVKNLLDSLLNLFCVKYTSNTFKKRRYILYFAVSLLVDTVNNDINISDDKDMLQIVVNKTNIAYEQLKENEEMVKTYSDNYNDAKKNIDKSLKKLEIMDNL